MMDILNKYLSTIRVPTNNDSIYNEECVYSFDSPVGIFYNAIKTPNQYIKWFLLFII